MRTQRCVLREPVRYYFHGFRGSILIRGHLPADSSRRPVHSHSRSDDGVAYLVALLVGIATAIAAV
jgi:hypothetical protein